MRARLEKTDNRPRPNKAPGARYAFVDLLRGLALIVMIETHVINAYLPLAARNNRIFFWLSFINGLVAPSFLFAAGFSLVLQARRQWESWVRLGPAFWKQVRRLGFILLVGYFLHLPHFGISKFLVAQGARFWKIAFQVDVLHCIVASLLFADLLIVLTRKPARFALVAALAGICAALAAPWMWAQNFEARLPVPIASFLNPNGISLFPLFPWISFVMAGCVAAHFFLAAAAEQNGGRFMKRILLSAVAIIPACLVARNLPGFEYWSAAFYTVSPLYVFIRIASVASICSGLYFMEKRLQWAPKAVMVAGQESLLVYSAHLILIFSVLRRTQFAKFPGMQLGYAGCFLLSAFLIALMILCAGWWHAWKKNRPRSARIALAALVTVNLAVFLLR